MNNKIFIKLPIKRLTHSVSMLMIVVVIVACAFAIVFLNLLSGNEVVISDDAGYYTFEPGSLLDSISKGNSDVFVKAEEPVNPIIPPYTGSVHWNSANYWQIAEAFHNFQWHESSTEWNLYQIDHSYDCNNLNDGPYDASYYFDRIAWDNGLSEFVKVIHEIHISLLGNEIYWGYIKRAWVLQYSPPINPARLKISAENALQIAEENGGKAARNSVQNECRITVALSSGEAWWIAYEGSSPLLYRVEIDPYTGQIIK